MSIKIEYYITMISKIKSLVNTKGSSFVSPALGVAGQGRH